MIWYRFFIRQLYIFHVLLLCGLYEDLFSKCEWYKSCYEQMIPVLARKRKS